MPHFQFGRLSVDLPAEYKLHGLMTVSPVEGVGGQTLLKSFSITQEPLAPGTSAEAFRARHIAEVRKLTPAFTVTKTGSLRVAGLDAFYLEATNVGPDGRPLGSVVAYVPLGPTVLVLVGSMQGGADFERAKPELLRLFEALTLAPG